MALLHAAADPIIIHTLALAPPPLFKSSIVFTNAIGDNPNKAVNSESTYKIPLYPQYEEAQEADLTEQGGAIGVTYGQFRTDHDHGHPEDPGT